MTDFPPCDDVCGAVEENVRRSFAGHEIETVTWTAGPILETNPHFRVARVAPASRAELWTYVSIGGWAATAETGHGLEFLLSVEEPTPRAVELLAMTVFYNRTVCHRRLTLWVCGRPARGTHGPTGRTMAS